MTKIYLMVLICTMVIGAYFFGIHVGNSECKIQNFQNQITIQENTEINKRVLNDKIYKTGVSDIRRILHDKYTIAE